MAMNNSHKTSRQQGCYSSQLLLLGGEMPAETVVCLPIVFSFAIHYYLHDACRHPCSWGEGGMGLGNCGFKPNVDLSGNLIFNFKVTVIALGTNGKTWSKRILGLQNA